jgi:hypothetical protein
MTKQPIADYDIYPKHVEGLYSAIDILGSEGELINISDKALTYLLYKVHDNEGARAIAQVVIDTYYDTSDKIFESFDFSVCMGAYDMDTYQFVYGDDFWKDNAARVIHFNPGTKYPFASLVRTNKYRKKGYHIPKAELMKIGIAVALRGIPKSWTELEESIGGFYGKKIRLMTEDKEYSLENVLDVLTNAEDFEYACYSDNEPIDISSDVLIARLDKTGDYRYFKTQKDGKILVFPRDDAPFSYTSKDGETLPDHWKMIGDEYYVETFKYVKKTDDPMVFTSPVHSSKLTYQAHMATEENNPPYIFVGKDVSMYGKNTDRVMFRVLVKPSDVMGVACTRQMHLTCRRVYFAGQEEIEKKGMRLVANPLYKSTERGL